mgnify:CR=1 FL=1
MGSEMCIRDSDNGEQSGSAYIFPLTPTEVNEVPAMGGIGLLALGLSMLGLGLMRGRNV